MRFFKWALMSLLVLFSSCLPGRFIWYNFSDITDHKIFPSRPLPKSETPFRFIDAQRSDGIGDINLFKVDSIVRANNSVAFLIIRNDSILYEQYYQKYTDESVIASFSAAKSYTSALIGAAIADGFIKNVNEPITKYIPELKSKTGFDKITIEHVLQMTSGIKANESYYNPFGQAASLYYGRSLRNYVKRLEVEYEPGTRFAYRSINTQLLGLIVERATGKTNTDYLNEKIWRHLGTEHDASWSIDRKKDGLEKTFCCINATARDFAKFGRLFLNEGEWNGQQLLPADWVRQSTMPTEENGASKWYKYQWWLTKNGYEAKGLHGQFIYVCPAKNVIIVRLGKRSEKLPWESLFDQLAERL
ncbi:MAG: serine hydrolase [Cyclobacteriaceae bacterium]|nr:serine hydrolase [Cyclobacteriaceae bacterium]